MIFPPIMGKVIIFSTFFSILFVLYSQTVMADYCSDNYTLASTEMINGKNITITENCTYGCDSSLNICVPSDFIILLIIIGVIFLLMVSGWFLFKKVLRI